MNPIVFLREGEIRSLFLSANAENGSIDGIGFAWDDYTVIHAHPRGSHSGYGERRLPVRFVTCGSLGDIAALQGLRSEVRIFPALIVFLELRESLLAARASLLGESHTSAECDVRLIPDR